MSFWTYMLHCRGGYFYVGHTDNLERRIAEHERGGATGFVADHGPARLVWSQAFSSREEALAAERRIKGWSRAKKMALIRGDWGEISRLAKNKCSPSTGSGRTGRDEPVLAPVRAEPVEALDLICHPDTPGSASCEITVHMNRREMSLSLRYELMGDLTELSIPAPAPPLRTDGLWQTTCFELFVVDGEGYREFNFSPSGAWAAYRFTGYREGMTSLDMPAPIVELEQNETRLALTATIDALALPPMPWIVGLSAVIEEQGGTKSYWALAHPPGRPDFHHPACFALQRPYPDQP